MLKKNSDYFFTGVYLIARPMISEHSAHLVPISWQCIYDSGNANVLRTTKYDPHKYGNNVLYALKMGIEVLHMQQHFGGLQLPTHSWRIWLTYLSVSSGWYNIILSAIISVQSSSTETESTLCNLQQNNAL